MDEGDSGTGRKREAVQQDSGPAQKKKRLFIRELKYMMHGFGDDLNPHTGEQLSLNIMNLRSRMDPQALKE